MSIILSVLTIILLVQFCITIYIAVRLCICMYLETFLEVEFKCGFTKKMLRRILKRCYTRNLWGDDL